MAHVLGFGDFWPGTVTLSDKGTLSIVGSADGDAVTLGRKKDKIEVARRLTRFTGSGGIVYTDSRTSEADAVKANDFTSGDGHDVLQVDVAKRLSDANDRNLPRHKRLACAFDVRLPG